MDRSEHARNPRKKALTMQQSSDKGLPMQTAASVRNDDSSVDPDTSHLVIEDDTPVDNIFTEKQERLLTSPLYASWFGPPIQEGQARRPFVVLANVGLFVSRQEQAIVPDVMLSLDVRVKDLSQRKNRTYFVWEFGKLPEVVIEIVSNREGGELSDKMQRYRRMGIRYYVVFDPDLELGPIRLRSFELRGDLYIALQQHYFDEVGLGLVEWTGVHEDFPETWLRWCTKDGRLIPTPEEQSAVAHIRADEERQRADEERQRADEARQRADEARQREDEARQREDEARQREDEARKSADEERKRSLQLEARLRALGIDPNAP
jgi:Putative restriction endonuclease